MYDILDDTGFPYLRPEEDPQEFADLAEDFRLRYQPDDPETEALVTSLTHTAWRLRRYLRDQAGIAAEPGIPRQADALAMIGTLIESLEKIYVWQQSALEFWPRIHTLDVSETTDCEGASEEMASFRQKYRELRARWMLSPPPPNTKPN